MSDEDEDLREIQSGIDAERERRQRAREAQAEAEAGLARAQQLVDQATAEWRRRRDEREAISRSVSVPFRAEPGASGTLTLRLGGQDVRRVDIGQAADLAMSYGAALGDPSFGASDLRGWVDAYDRIAVPMPVRVRQQAGRRRSARIARHFYRQRDAALKRVSELEAALEEAHRRMIRFRMRIDGGEA